MRAREQDTGRLGAKPRAARDNTLTKREPNVPLPSRTPAKGGVGAKEPLGKREQGSGHNVRDENVRRDPNHGLSLTAKPKLCVNIYDNLAQTQAVGVNAQENGTRGHKRAISGVPLNGKPALAQKKVLQAQNVPNEAVPLKPARSVAKAPKSALSALTPTAAGNQSAKFGDPVRNGSLARPHTPGFNCAVRKPVAPASYMTDLARQYDELCAMEQQKLRKLEGIITRKQQVDTELTELVRGRAGAK